MGFKTSLAGGWKSTVRRLFRDQQGNVSPLLAILIVPLIGGIALASEVSGWASTERSMQNAADSAAVAAASNGCDPSDTCHTTNSIPTYIDEARAVSTRFGFTDGANNTTVTAADAQACPDGINTNCYKVTITRDLPARLVRVVGFNGNQSGGSMERVVATAMASTFSPGSEFCVIALAKGLQPNQDAFTIKGGPNFNLGGCAVASDASTNCTSGHDFKIAGVTAVGNADLGCANPPANNLSSQSAVADPFAGLSTPANIPTGCTTLAPIAATPGPIGTTWDLTHNDALTPLKSCNTPAFTGSGVITVTTASPGSVLIIAGGNNLNIPSGITLRAAVGSGLTVVYTGTAGGAPGFVTGSGIMDWGAPRSGTWSGVAMYQDARMTANTSVVYAGNSPTFNLTGLIYAPYADLEFKGAINHQTGGLNCLGVIASTVTIKGTGSIFQNPTSQCFQAGLTLPTTSVGLHARARLVQ